MNKKKYFEISKRSLLEQMNMDETFDELRNSPNYEILRDALKKNKIIGVAYVKKDGTVRHMSIKRTLGAYEGSEREKTDAQANLNQNNNVKKVIDINVYKKALKEFNQDKSKAATAAWRTINLDTVLGFVFGSHFIDLREDNQILERFGEAVYQAITPSMIRAMEAQQAQLEAEENALNESELDKLIKQSLRRGY